MFKRFKPKEVNKLMFDNPIYLVKIEETVPKVADVVKNLRKDKAALQELVSALKADAASAQERVNKLEAILFSLLSEDGGSMGGVV